MVENKLLILIKFMTNIFTPLRFLFSKKELIGELVYREMRDRHSGQILGKFWAYGHPLLLMLIYSFLFSYVFPTRFSNETFVRDFSVNVLAGILPWLAFQDILSRASSILLGHANLVKQIVFPIEVLPLKTVFAGIIPYGLGTLFVIVYALFNVGYSWLFFTLVVLILSQIVAMTGVAYLLSAAGVFVRDVRDIIIVFCSVNLFAQPILYNPFATPEWMNWIFMLNPFSHIVWCWQDALYFGAINHPVSWILFPIGSLLILIIGWSTFDKTKHLLGDAL